MKNVIQISIILSGIVPGVFRDPFTRFFNGFITAFDRNGFRRDFGRNNSVCQSIIIGNKLLNR
jgi:hypothetical protein